MSTLTTCAPSQANASAILWPIPPHAPVAMATLLVNRLISINVFGLVKLNCSAQLQRHGGVHVVEHLVFAGHAPDEFVIARAATEVHGPVRRQRDFFIVQKQ